MYNNKKRVMSVCITVFVLLAAISPSFALGSDAGGHWAAEEINKWIDRGIINGYDDGTFRPDNPITRAEFVTIICRLFNYVDKSDETFPDVADSNWFAGSVSEAVASGIIVGDSEGKFRPYDPITRQEAAVVFYRAFQLKVANKDAAGKFVDASSIASWSKDALSALVENSYMSGRPGNKLAPKDNITRAEAVKMIDNIACELKNESGTYSGNVTGSLVVNTADVVLKDMVISGDLYLAQGIGDGDITLDNVTVSGRTVVMGGGENSIIINNSSLSGTLMVIKKDGKVRIVAKGTTEVSGVQLGSGAKLQEDNVTGKGFSGVEIIEVEPGQEIKLDGDFDVVSVNADEVSVEVVDGTVGTLEVKNSAENSNIKVTSGTVEELKVEAKASVQLDGGTVNTLNIAKTASGASVQMGEQASITNLTADASVNVTGEGTIQKAVVNADDVTIEQQPEETEVAPEVTTNIGGEEVVGDTTTPVTPPPTTPTTPTDPTPTVAVSSITVNGSTSSPSLSAAPYNFSFDGAPDSATINGIQVNSSTTEAKVNVTQVTVDGLSFISAGNERTNLPVNTPIDMVTLIGNGLGADGVSLGNLREFFGINKSIIVTGYVSAPNCNNLNVTVTINIGSGEDVPNADEYVTIEKNGTDVIAIIKAGKEGTTMSEINLLAVLDIWSHTLVSYKIDGQLEQVVNATGEVNIKSAIQTWTGVGNFNNITLGDLRTATGIDGYIKVKNPVNNTDYTIKVQ